MERYKLEIEQSKQTSIITKESFTLNDTKELEIYFKKNSSIKFIQKVIDDKIKFDMNSLIYMMQTNTKRRNREAPIIDKVEDIKTTAKYKNMICMIENEKELYIAGDIHADFISLTQIFKKTGFYDDYINIDILFLGDYVDRGKNRLNVINLLVTLEFLLPQNIWLLKGNHELFVKDENNLIKSPMMGSENNISYFFTFLNMLSKHQEYKNSFPKYFIESYADYFDNLPIVGLLNFEEIKIMAVHGGLPRPSLNIDNYYENKNLNSYLDKNTKDFVGMTMQNSFLWSDPYDKAHDGFRYTSNSRFQFNQNHFIAFSKQYGVDLLLRAHEAQNDGYKTYFDGRLISVFSTGGKDLKGNLNENTHSNYVNVSPNILYIDKYEKLIKSFEIFFDDSDMIYETKINFSNIRLNKTNQELFFENYIAPNISKSTLTRKLSESKKLIISDKFNTYLRKVIDLSDKNGFSFKQINEHNKFYGIHKDMDFYIDIKLNAIINRSDIDIYVDKFVVTKNESIPFSETEYIFQSGAVLNFILIE